MDNTECGWEVVEDVIDAADMVTAVRRPQDEGGEHKPEGEEGDSKGCEQETCSGRAERERGHPKRCWQHS